MADVDGVQPHRLGHRPHPDRRGGVGQQFADGADEVRQEFGDGNHPATPGGNDSLPDVTSVQYSVQWLIFAALARHNRRMSATTVE